jgi:transposase
MTVDRQTELEIRRLFFAEHWKRGTIAAQLAVHSDVVDRVIGHLGPQPKHGEPRPSVLDPYRSFVLETLQRYPGLVSTRIYDMIVERGYTGSLRTLRRFALLHRPEVPREVYVRIETLAGEQSQIDWAHGTRPARHVDDESRHRPQAQCIDFGGARRWSERVERFGRSVWSAGRIAG